MMLAYGVGASCPKLINPADEITPLLVRLRIRVTVVASQSKGKFKPSEPSTVKFSASMENEPPTETLSEITTEAGVAWLPRAKSFTKTLWTELITEASSINV